MRCFVGMIIIKKIVAPGMAIPREIIDACDKSGCQSEEPNNGFYTLISPSDEYQMKV
jgi:hypothetical protein